MKPDNHREASRLGVHIADFRPPHTETGLADRAIAGVAPSFGKGLDPVAVARRMVDAIVADEPGLASTDFD